MSSSIVAAIDSLIRAVVFIDSLVSRSNSLIVVAQLSPFNIDLVLDCSLSSPLLRCDIWFAIIQLLPSKIGISLPSLELSILSVCL